MNGYELHSNSYKQYLSDHPEITQERKEAIEGKIKALDFLATATDREALELFNSGAFNDVVTGYIKMAADNIELKEETLQELLDEIKNLFDVVEAEQARQYDNRLR